MEEKFFVVIFESKYSFPIALHNNLETVSNVSIQMVRSLPIIFHYLVPHHVYFYHEDSFSTVQSARHFLDGKIFTQMYKQARIMSNQHL